MALSLSLSLVLTPTQTLIALHLPLQVFIGFSNGFVVRNSDRNCATAICDWPKIQKLSHYILYLLDDLKMVFALANILNWEIYGFEWRTCIVHHIYKFRLPFDAVISICHALLLSFGWKKNNKQTLQLIKPFGSTAFT